VNTQVSTVPLQISTGKNYYLNQIEKVKLEEKIQYSIWAQQGILQSSYCGYLILTGLH